MINKEILNKYDTQCMYKIYDNWSKIARDSYEKKIAPLRCDNVNHVVFVGMGGSGTVSDIYSKFIHIIYMPLHFRKYAKSNNMIF